MCLKPEPEKGLLQNTTTDPKQILCITKDINRLIHSHSSWCLFLCVFAHSFLLPFPNTNYCTKQDVKRCLAHCMELNCSMGNIHCYNQVHKKYHHARYTVYFPSTDLDIKSQNQSANHFQFIFLVVYMKHFCHHHLVKQLFLYNHPVSRFTPSYS